MKIQDRTARYSDILIIQGVLFAMYATFVDNTIWYLLLSGIAIAHAVVVFMMK